MVADHESARLVKKVLAVSEAFENFNLAGCFKTLLITYSPPHQRSLRASNLLLTCHTGVLAEVL